MTAFADPDCATPARLIQLVARFRPDADGVGETALRLADALASEHGIASDFLVWNPPRDPVLGPVNHPHSAMNLDAAPRAFDDALARLSAGASRPPALLAHYASYGYSRHGIPFWLPRSLHRFKARGGHLITLFHELYAAPKLFSKTMIASAAQRHIYRRVLAMSDAAFTSNEDFLGAMRRDSHAEKPVSLIGICSSAGEPARPRPLAERKRRIAVFGRFVTRKDFYVRAMPMLARIAEHLGAEEIADIGAMEDPEWFNRQVAAPLGSLVKGYGTLPIEAASELMGDSAIGALAYPHFLTGKSSVFAAYQAHAMAILLISSQEFGEPPLSSWPMGPEALLALPARSSELWARLQESADSAHRHYQRHRSAHSMAATIFPALKAAGLAS